MRPVVIAQQDGERAFLVRRAERDARVVDLEPERVHPAHAVQSILARGGWVGVTDVAGAELALELATEAWKREA